MTECDIAIVGGGLVGASLAAALADSPLQVLLAEAAPPPSTAPARGKENQGPTSLLDASPAAPPAPTALRAGAVSGRLATRRREAWVRERAETAPTGTQRARASASPPAPTALRAGAVSGPPWDERCIALNDASRRVFESLGLWAALRGEAEPILATHISERGRFGTVRFAAAEAGLEALGYNLPLRALGAALASRLAAQNRLRLLQPARVVAVADRGEAMELSIEHGGAVATVRARLLVAADGARSPVRAMLGVPVEERDYGQQAIVSAVRVQRPHRGVAYERFTEEGPLALIPKPGAAASLVWTVPAARLEGLLALDDAAYLQQAQEVFGGRLGRFTALGRRWAFPLARVMSGQLTAPRTVFIGNAAQSLHPVAAQGFNLGLRDVAALAAALAAAPDPGAADLLATYAERRERDRDRVSGLTDLMVRVFSNRVPGLAQARHWGLVAVDLAAPLRETVLRQHLGHLGLPPSSLAN